METISLAGTNWNEDFAYANKNFAFVIDGATSLTPDKFSNEETDAKWFSNCFGSYLKTHLKDLDSSITTIIKKGIHYVDKKYSKLTNGAKVIDKPSATISVVRKSPDGLEYFVLGDCGVLFKHKNKVKEFVRKDIINLDKKNVKKMIKISKQKHISVYEAKTYVADDILAVRFLRNKKHGYWSLGDLEEACDHALTGTIKTQPNDEVLLFSDGFSRIWNLIYIFNKKEVFEYLSKNSLSDLANLLFKTQKADPGCNKYPRMKVCDDASAVYFKI